MLLTCVTCTGPVFVEFPIDTLYPYELVAHEAGVSTGKTLGQRLINMSVTLTASMSFASRSIAVFLCM